MNQNIIPIGLLETAFCSQYYAEYLNSEKPHNAALRFVNQLVRHTKDVTWIRQIVASGLPVDYKGNTIEEVEIMVRDAIKLGYTEPRPNSRKQKKKESVTQRVNEALEERDYTLFHDEQKRGFISIVQPSGGKLTYLLKSDAAQRWVRQVHFETEETGLSAQNVSEVIETLEARASFTGMQEEVYLRAAGYEQEMYVDLGRGDAKLVRITAEGWELTYDAPVKFYRSAGFLELPEPVSAGKLKKLRDLLQLDERNWVLLVAFLLNCLSPKGPYMCLLVEGEQGSGKSFICEAIKQIYRMAVPYWHPPQRTAGAALGGRGF